MEHDDLKTACQRFEESERLDPAAGTLMNWAECLNRQGKLVASMLKWREALDALPPADERRTGAEERIAALRLRVPRLAIHLAPSAPAGAIVVRDAAAIDAAALGIEIPVDAGEHRIAVSAPGRMTTEVVVKIAEGERRTITVTAGHPVSAFAPASRSTDHSAPSETPVGAWIVGGVGAAALLTGGTFGVLAIVENGKVNDECHKTSSSLQCSQAGMDAARAGDTYATVANVLVPIGLVGLGVGAGWLWASSGGQNTGSLRAAPVGSHGASLNFASTF